MDNVTVCHESMLMRAKRMAESRSGLPEKKTEEKDD